MRAHHRTDARILARVLLISALAGAGYGAAQGLNLRDATQGAWMGVAVATWCASYDLGPILLRGRAEATEVFALARRAA